MSKTKPCLTNGRRTIVLVDEGGCAYFCTLGDGHQGICRWEPAPAKKEWVESVNTKAVTR